MRLEVEVSDNAVRLSSPDIPGMVRLARGQEQLWREFRNFIGAHRGVEAGSWKIDQDATIDDLLRDAEGSTSSATRAAARRLRASWTKLQHSIEDSKAADAAERRRQEQLAAAEEELRKAQDAAAAAREKVRSLKVKRKGTPASPGNSSPARRAAAAARVVPSVTEIAERRQRIQNALDAGITSPAAISASTGIDVKTIGNDLRRMKPKTA